MNKNTVIGIIAVVVILGVAGYFLMGSSGGQAAPTPRPVAATRNAPEPSSEVSPDAGVRSGGTGTLESARLEAPEEQVEETTGNAEPPAPRKAVPRTRRTQPSTTKKPAAEKDEAAAPVVKAAKPPASPLQGD